MASSRKVEPASKPQVWPLNKIIPYPNNPRTHPDNQIELLAALMQKHGVDQPIVVDEHGFILKGHGRRLAAVKAGFEDFPVVIHRGLSDAAKRAIRVSDNQVQLLSGWNEQLLRVELGDLSKAGYEMPLLGFNDVQLVSFMTVPANKNDLEQTPEAPLDPVTRVGDIWQLGRHRLMCGDSRSVVDVRRLLGTTIPDIANCDPPYGVNIVKTKRPYGHDKEFGKNKKDRKLGRVHGVAGPTLKHPELRIATGIYAPIIGDDSTDTAVASHEVMRAIGIPIIVLWGGNYFANSLPPSRCWFVWDKKVTGMFADVELAWTNCDQVARIFHHEWNGLMKASERGEKRVHPTQKPVALAEWVIETAAPGAANYIDLFMGSGASLIACERKKIACFGMEMAEAYCDVSVERWQTFAKAEATLDGKTYAEVAKARKKKAPAKKPGPSHKARKTGKAVARQAAE